MSATELRKAAETLRNLGGSATDGPWSVEDNGSHGHHSWALEIERWRGYRNYVSFGEDRETADYVATMHPGVGLALADLLDFAAETAQGWERIGNLDPSGWPEPTRLAHILARIINGGAA